MTQLVENINTDLSYILIREVKSGVREMSEHSLSNMLHPPGVRVKITVKSNRVREQQKSYKARLAMICDTDMLDLSMSS